MRQDRWADKLEEQLKDYQESPSSDLWAGIEARLDNEAGRGARVVWLRRWAVAAVLVGVLFGGGNVVWQQFSADAVMPTGAANVAAQADAGHDDGADNLSGLSVAVPQETTQNRETINNNRETINNNRETINNNRETINNSRETIDNNRETIDNNHETINNNREVIANVGEPKTIQYSLSTVHSPGRVSLNLYASGGAKGVAQANGVLMSPSMLQNFALSRASRADDSQVYLAGYEEREHHDRPLSFGLTASYQLVPRLSVSTGLVYTKLNSEFVTVMRQDRVTRHQRLHYMGIPLNLRYDFWRWRGLSIYGSAGMQADWNVSAKADTDGIEQEQVEKDRLQWSAGGSLGIQYDVLPPLGVYVEPGFRYYFDNGSNVKTYFKEHPADFSLQLGVRLSW